MKTLREKIYHEPVPREVTCIMGVDIGGTNSNFGIFQNKNGTLTLLFSVHAKSQDVQDFSDLFVQVVVYCKERYDIVISAIMIGVAGVVSPQRDYCKPTNLNNVVDAHAIRKALEINDVWIANDFEIIGYGLGLIDQKNIVSVHEGDGILQAHKAILGSGTGLGKSIFYWNQKEGRYDSLASEGGHSDFAIQDDLELALVRFIQEQENFTCNISWEDVLSGQGIRRLYQFFYYKQNGSIAPADTAPHPDEIFNSRNTNDASRQTFELYTKLYARCAKDFALDALALAGVYIAGGIAANNLEMFQQDCFIESFINCGKMQALLKKIPIYVITDYNVSLYGAAQFLVYKKSSLQGVE